MCYLFCGFLCFLVNKFDFFFYEGIEKWYVRMDIVFCLGRDMIMLLINWYDSFYFVLSV